MQLKREFCARYGAEEFYIIYPEYPNDVEAWLRSGDDFVRVDDIDRFVSPRVGFRFVLEDGQLTVFGPDSREWKSPDVAFRQLEDAENDRESERARAEKERTRAESEREFAQYERTRAEKEHKRAESESTRADNERELAQHERTRANSESTRADNERELAQHERMRAERFAEKLRRLGIDPNAE